MSTTGKLNLVDKTGKIVHSQHYFREVNIRTQPELHSFGDPTFRITIPEFENGMPVVILDIPAFGQYYWDQKPSNRVKRRSIGLTKL